MDLVYPRDMALTANKPLQDKPLASQPTLATASAMIACLPVALGPALFCRHLAAPSSQVEALPDLPTYRWAVPCNTTSCCTISPLHQLPVVPLSHLQAVPPALQLPAAPRPLQVLGMVTPWLLQESAREGVTAHNVESAPVQGTGVPTRRSAVPSSDPSALATLHGCRKVYIVLGARQH